MPVLGSRVIDFGLHALATESDALFLCNSEPSDYADVLAYALGSKGVGAGNLFGSPADATPSGRKVTATPISGGVVNRGGQAVVWAAVNSAGTTPLMQHGSGQQCC